METGDGRMEDSGWIAYSLTAFFPNSYKFYEIVNFIAEDSLNWC